MIVTEIPFNQMFHFETRPRIIPVSPETLPSFPTGSNQIDWKKTILITGGVIAIGVIAYQIWKIHQMRKVKETGS